MKIAKVVNGEIRKVRNSIPENLENTSNFSALSLDEMAMLNWYPIREVYPERGLYESYGEPTIEILPAEVVYTYPVIQPTLAYVQKARKKEFKDELSSRVYALRDIDEFMVLLLTATLSNSLKTKIADLSAAYEAAVSALNATTTVADALAVTVSWPAS